MVSPLFVPGCRMMVSPLFVPDCRMMVSLLFVPDCRMMVSSLFVPGCRMMVSPLFVPDCRMMVSPLFVPDCRMMVSPLFVPGCRMMVSPLFVPDCRMISPLFVVVVAAVSDFCAGSSHHPQPTTCTHRRIQPRVCFCSLRALTGDLWTLVPCHSGMMTSSSGSSSSGGCMRFQPIKQNGSGNAGSLAPRASSSL